MTTLRIRARVMTSTARLSRLVVLVLLLVLPAAVRAAHDASARTTLATAGFAITPPAATAPPILERSVSLPHAWELTDPAATGDGWYALDWFLGASPHAPQAVYLAALTVPAQVLVNGAVVGGMALDGPPPRSYEQGQLARVPAELLKAGHNAILVHVRARHAGTAGLGVVVVGSLEAVRERELEDLATRTFAPAAVSVATFTVGLFIFVLWLRRRDPGYALFGTAAMLWSVHTLVSLLPDPLLPQPHWWVMWHTVYLAFVALLCLFCVHFAGLQWRPYRALVVLYAAATLPVLYAANALGVADIAAPAVRLGAIGLVLVALAAVARYTLRLRNLESGLLLLTGAVSTVFAVHDWLASQSPVDLRPVWLVPYAALAFLTLVGYILTDRFVRALNAAERTNVELERRVEEKSAALGAQLVATQRARDAAETANRAKSSFLAAASHDLRQPLHALGMFSQALAEQVREPEAAALVSRITASVASLETLFSALLDVSKLDAGVVTPQRRDIAVRPLLGRVVDDFMPEALERELTLRIACNDVWVHSDPVLLERILRNLVANAVRYTERGGVLLACRRRGAYCSLEVWDSGSGIAATERERIFEEFYQVSNPARDRARGLGLGLAIVRRLADLLDHPVTLHSREGRGSVFRVRVPAGRAVGDGSRPVDAIVDAVAGHTVLLVDDEIEVRDATVELLRRWGCRVAAFADGESAHAACAAGLRPDAMVVDYRLGPGMDGLATIAALRATLGARTPAMLVSGESEAVALARIEATGVALLHKPLPPARLRSVLAHLFATATKQEALAR